MAKKISLIGNLIWPIVFLIKKSFKISFYDDNVNQMSWLRRVQIWKCDKSNYSLKNSSVGNNFLSDFKGVLLRLKHDTKKGEVK